MAGTKKKPKELTPEAVIRKKRRSLRDRAAVKSLIAKIILLAIAAFVLIGVIFGLTPMRGSDMVPELSSGDLILYYRLEDNYARNDVVVMKRDGKEYIGRIIGMPGDTLSITDKGVININVNNVIEEGIYFETKPYKGAQRYPLKLKGDEYFLLGDKRDTAKDSRYFGAVSKEELKGKVITSIRRTDI